MFIEASNGKGKLNMNQSDNFVVNSLTQMSPAKIKVQFVRELGINLSNSCHIWLLVWFGRQLNC